MTNEAQGLTAARTSAQMLELTEPPVDLSSNDYLGLRDDPRVRAAAVAAIERFGVGSGGVRDVSVGADVVVELEARIAKFKGTGYARMVQSGYAANVGVIPLLVGPGDLVLLDRQDHQSSKDGASLSGAEVVLYPHADVDALAGALAECAASAQRKLIVTDGVFGLEGDIAPLREIVGVAERFGAIVMVDDAHGSGVLGSGKGTVTHFGLTDRVAVQVGTASKAMGVLGGYVATSMRELVSRFGESRPVAHSTALPPHLAAACLAALDIMESEPERIERLWANRARLVDALRGFGLDVGRSETPIVPVITRDPTLTSALGKDIRRRGVLAGVLVPPKVAADESRLRLIATASHSAAAIDRAASVIAAAARRFAA